MGLFIFMDDQFNTTVDDIQDDQYPVFDLSTDDNRLSRLFRKSFDESLPYWNNKPFELEKNDRENLDYFLGNQVDMRSVRKGSTVFIDNRMLTSTRAVLAYVNSRVAMPDVIPSSDKQSAIQFSKSVRQAMYQHGQDHNLKVKVKKSTSNLVVRKRGFLKLRFDPNIGEFGEICVDLVDPSNILVDKHAKYYSDPMRIFEKQTCTLEELIGKFPKKEKEIFDAYGIKRGIFSQMSRMVTYYEVWFTYYEDGKRKEGLAWWMPQGGVILGKMSNPNWKDTGDEKENKRVNFAPFPIKPYVVFNYLNSGKSYIDETSLFEQAKYQQDILNKRGQQIIDNADYANGRVIADGSAMTQEDADSFLNKNPKTIMLIKPSDGQSVNSSVMVVPQTQLPQYTLEDKYDARNEIDQIMGTPNIFRGEQSKNNTLGQDERIVQQAGALQDDLAGAIDDAMTEYYKKLYQMFIVYYTEDHWFQIKGTGGSYEYIMLNSETMDGNVKVNVEASSTLPADKNELRKTAIELAKLNRIDDLTLFEDLGLPDAEKRAERLAKFTNDPQGYVMDVEEQLFNREADTDIALIIAGKEPIDREEYGQAYLEYFNNFIMGKKFLTLPEEAQNAIKDHLSVVGLILSRKSNLETTQVDDAAQAGMTEQQAQTMV